MYKFVTYGWVNREVMHLVAMRTSNSVVYLLRFWSFSRENDSPKASLFHSADSLEGFLSFRLPSAGSLGDGCGDVVGQRNVHCSCDLDSDETLSLNGESIIVLMNTCNG